MGKGKCPADLTCVRVGHLHHEHGDVSRFEPLEQKVFIATLVFADWEVPVRRQVQNVRWQLCGARRFEVIDRVGLVANVLRHAAVLVEVCDRGTAPTRVAAPVRVAVAAIVAASWKHVANAGGRRDAGLGAVGESASDSTVVEVLRAGFACAARQQWWRRRRRRRRRRTPPRVERPSA